MEGNDIGSQSEANEPKKERVLRPLTDEELKKFGKSLMSHPTTPDAHHWLVEKGEDRNPRLYSWRDPSRLGMLQARARNLGHQLNLNETQELHDAYLKLRDKESVEREALYDPRPDKEGVTALGGEKAPCGFPVLRDDKQVSCGFEVELTTWRVVRDGQVLRFGRGPRAGQEIRKGPFAITKTGEVVLVCSKHRKELEQNGQRTYPYAEAKRRVEAKEFHQEALGVFEEIDRTSRQMERNRHSRDNRGFGDRRR